MKRVGWARLHGWALCLLSGVAAPAAEAGPLQAIIVEPATANGEPLDVWKHPGQVPERLKIDLEPGDDMGGRVLRVRPAPGGVTRYRVRVQFETSAAISGEGPHIDLLDWRHCRSEWRTAQPEGGDGFRLPMPEDRDHSCFPKATRAELRTAVKQALGEYGFDRESEQWWLDAVDRVHQVGESPSYVAISTVRVHVEQYDGSQWRVLTTIDFNLPMGC